ncbi:MAG: DUF1015 domain-containing protein [Thermoleophilia bacterium]|nr:DUF1015 domain-containing protein [Thermoleophilia bacterium]
MTKLAHVIPFRGVRYNQRLIPDLQQVVTPPYDIISPRQQKLYHRLHPLNAIHLDYGLSWKGDGDGDNRYTRAAATLNLWLDEKILVPDPAPALYFLREEFTDPEGQPAVREGFLAAVKLAEFAEGIIMPHEETAAGPKEDRLRLMDATEANLSAIFCLYSDPRQKIVSALRKAAERDADIALAEDGGDRHFLWAISDEDVTSLVTRELAGQSLLIADGHHRYETALAYRNARRRAEGAGGDMPYDYLMVYLSHVEGSSPSILPIHRLIGGLKEETLARLPELLGPEFEIEEAGGPGSDRARTMIEKVKTAGRQRNAFGLYLPGQGRYYVLRARSPRPVLDPAATGHSEAWCSLDVAVLDRLVLFDSLEIRPGGLNAGAVVSYVERTGQAIREAEKCDAAFFINPTSMEEVKAVAETGEKMPQKSTYFHPKPLTGLVFRCFRFE